MKKICIFWHRRDLRLEDNAGAFRALRSGYPVLPLFIFDRNILDDLDDRADPRVTFLHRTLCQMEARLQTMGSGMLIRYGQPGEVWMQILREFEVAEVYTNRDYEPYAKDRDAGVASLLEAEGIPFHTSKDHVIFEEKEVLTQNGGVYTVFTPYSRAWKARLASREGAGISAFLAPYDNQDFFHNYWQHPPFPIPSLESMGFTASDLDIPPPTVTSGLVRNYDKTRDFPGIRGTTRLGIHFRFGTISIREKAAKALQLNETYLNELIWRDFYAQILANFPHVAERAFRPEYDFIEWRNNEEAFRAWCEGRTGYPLVDAGMRELNATGYMHNRVRMVTASFLTKHLLIDWRWGEAYFASKLLDFDLASNNGGWQWAAGSGTDAAPYFRIFNPESQLKKFDKDLVYVRKWAPEYGTAAYPAPVVDHKMARERCLATYKRGLEAGKAALN